MNIETKNYCYLQSETCRAKLEEWQQKVEKMKKTLLCSAVIPVFVYMFIQLLFYANDNLDEVPEIPGVLYAIYFIYVAIVIFGETKINKDSRERYTRFLGYCECEKLLLLEDRVTGTSTRGDFQLEYKNIANVSHVSATFSSEVVSQFDNDILIITDVAGNKFQFNSFVNCKEIKLMIEMRKNSVGGGNEDGKM